MSATAFLGLLREVPGFWGFALGALALILSAVSVVWVSAHRSRVLLARIEAARATRMFELETGRRKMLLEAGLRGELPPADRRPEVEFPLRPRAGRPQASGSGAKAA